LPNKLTHLMMARLGRNMLYEIWQRHMYM
jgi:hypothetical protein